MTGETIVDAAALGDELTAVRGTGVAAEHDEAILGESSLAAPVFDTTGTAVGAVSLVMPSSEWPPTDTLRDDLRETARNISRELGATAWPVSAQPAQPASA
jgi:DNA-binding IclR family transcriptional regulator